MAIYENDQPVTLYQGDYTPAEMYADGKKVAGFVTQELADQSISAEGTYHDVLDITLKGKHEQKQYQGYNLVDIKAALEYWNAVYTEANGVYTITSIGSAYGKPYIFRDKYDGTLFSLSVIQTNNKLTTNCRVAMCYVDEYGNRSNFSAINWADGTKTVATTSKVNAIYLDYSTAVAGWSRTIEQLMVVEGRYTIDTLPAYEPYVGAVPSPNPQYPQDIVPLEQESLYVRSINYCPPLKEWTLRDGAYLDDEGYIALPDETSRAAVRIPWNTDGYRLSVYADTQKLTDDYSTFLLNVMYYDQNMVRITGNGNATEMTRTPSRQQMGFGSTSNNSIYAAAIYDAAYVYVEFTRGTVYGTRPYRFKNVSITDITSIEENRRFVLGRMPQTLEQHYQLYGSDGVFDTLEPCVMVDGEWKCRVTRRWKKLIYDGTQEVRCDTNHLTALNRLFNYVYDYSIVTKVKNSSIAYCDKAVYSTSIGNAYDRSSVVTTSVVSIFIPNQALEGNTAAEYYQRCREYLKNNPYTCLYQLAIPAVEYYDPIMLYTNPGSTIIKGNTDMVARIKTVDNGMEVTQAIKTQAEMPEAAELQTDSLP